MHVLGPSRKKKRVILLGRCLSYLSVFSRARSTYQLMEPPKLTRVSKITLLPVWNQTGPLGTLEGFSKTDYDFSMFLSFFPCFTLEFQPRFLAFVYATNSCICCKNGAVFFCWVFSLFVLTYSRCQTGHSLW